jgi:hypothetical protein
MARGTNLIKSEEIKLTVNAQTVWYLDRLIETGLYGNTRQEAARTVLFDHCKLLITEHKLGIAPAFPSTSVAEVGQG